MSDQIGIWSVYNRGYGVLKHDKVYFGSCMNDFKAVLKKTKTIINKSQL